MVGTYVLNVIYHWEERVRNQVVQSVCSSDIYEIKVKYYEECGPTTHFEWLYQVKSQGERNQLAAIDGWKS